MAFPIKKIPETFLSEYYEIVSDKVRNMTETKKFFVFIAQNNLLNNQNKKNIIAKKIDKKNNDWLKKYINHHLPK